MKFSDAIKVFLLGMMTAFLAIVAFRPSSVTAQAADGGGTSGAANGLIAVTGPQNASLFVIDSREQQVTYYQAMGNKLDFRSARLFKYDLRLIEQSGRRLSVEDAYKLAKQQKDIGD